MSVRSRVGAASGGALLLAALMALLCTAPARAAPPPYYPPGPQKDVPRSALTGWDECHRSNYNDSNIPLAGIFAACDGAFLLLAGGPVGAATFQVLAAAPRADVIFDTGHGNVPHDANGSGWYFSSDWSWGFAPQGAAIARGYCDTVDSSFQSGAFGDLRLCWHTVGCAFGDLCAGWRSGRSDSLQGGRTTHERLIYESDGTPEPPTLSATDPPSPANDNAPRVQGSAEAGSQVRLYAAAGCTGSVLASGSAADLAGAGIAIGVADNSTTVLSATATDARGVSGCSGSLEYVEQTPPPPPVAPVAPPPPPPPVAAVAPPPPATPPRRAQPRCPLTGPQVAGSPAADALAGGPLTGDVLFGLAGDDVLRGRGGRDCLYGGDGDDRLLGGRGVDRLFGGAGDDRLFGEDGVTDAIGGGEAREGGGGDRLDGGPGSDRLTDLRGDATLSGSSGDDVIDARDFSPGDRRKPDAIACGAGRDLVHADAVDKVADDCERVTRRAKPRGRRA